MTRALKNVALKLAKVIPLRWIPLDPLLGAVMKTSSALAGLLFVRDWRIQVHGRPQFFKHRINVARWIKEPERWSFTARGVLARASMFKGCKVLDLCCGDGFYTYLFFSDIAGHIDAIDLDAYAIRYAKAHHAAPNIHFHEKDILTETLPSGRYDVVVWNAAICYFALEHIHLILRKIVDSGTPSMMLKGMLPRANGWIDHKTEFAEKSGVESLLLQHFTSVSVIEVEEASGLTFYFDASGPTKRE